MSNLNGFVTTADEVASACDLMGRIFSKNSDKMEGTAMQATYKGFTGEIVKLERHTIAFCTEHYVYDLSIYDCVKRVTHSFTGVNLEDVKFLGGTAIMSGTLNIGEVSFGG